MDLMDLLSSEYFFIIPALWVLGYALKRTPRIPDWSIIWLITLFSLTISFLSFGFSPDSIINGITAAGISVYGHQIVKQTAKKRKTDGKSKQ